MSYDDQTGKFVDEVDILGQIAYLEGLNPDEYRSSCEVAHKSLNEAFLASSDTSFRYSIRSSAQLIEPLPEGEPAQLSHYQEIR